MLARVPGIVTTVHNVEAWKQRCFLRWIDAWTTRYAHRLIACSGRVADNLRELNPVPMDKVTVIRNGIRLQAWLEQPDAASVTAVRHQFGGGPNDFLLGVLGRLEVQKGHC
jgi:hypothetical protein